MDRTILYFRTPGEKRVTIFYAITKNVKGNDASSPGSSVSPSAVPEPHLHSKVSGGQESLCNADSRASRISIFSQLFKEAGANKI